jgi:hypothetical protein
VLIANSNLVPHWGNWDEFRRLEAMGLIMFGQMTAGSWIYIGTQGILQGTYETFVAAGRKHFGSSLKGKLVVTGGLGGMGGAQPLAATMAEGTFLGADVDRSRIEKRVATGYCDVLVDNLDEAIRMALDAKANGEAKSIGVVANACDLLARLIEKDIVPDLLTDQTSAHDALNGYVPERDELRGGSGAAGVGPEALRRRVDAHDGRPRPSHAHPPGARRAHLRLRQQPPRHGPRGGRRERVRLPGLRPRLHPTALLRGQGAVPVGGAERRPGGHPPHRRPHPGDVPGERGPLPLDPHGARQGPLPGPAEPHLLAQATASERGSAWR